MAHLLRCLFFLEAQHDLTLTAEYIRGSDNGAADAISRNQLDVFACMCPQSHRRQTPVSQSVVEKLVMDMQWTSYIWKYWLATL